MRHSTSPKSPHQTRALVGHSLSERGWSRDGAADVFVREIGYGMGRKLLRVALVEDAMGAIELVGTVPGAHVIRGRIDRGVDALAEAAGFAHGLVLSVGQKLARDVLNARQASPSVQSH